MRPEPKIAYFSYLSHNESIALKNALILSPVKIDTPTAYNRILFKPKQKKVGQSLTYLEKIHPTLSS